MATSITDWSDLDSIRNNLATDFVLENDLDSNTAGYDTYASSNANSGNGWDPIGSSSNPFTGSLDGQGYTIADLYIDRTSELQVGLFEYGDGCTIQNFTLDAADISAAENYDASMASGSILARTLEPPNAKPTLTNIDITNLTMSGGYTIGGLFGDGDVDISDCTVSGTLTQSGETQIAGVAGRLRPSATMTNVDCDATLTGSVLSGVVLEVDGATVKDCTFTGTFDSANSDNIGGFAGHINNSNYLVKRCKAEVDCVGAGDNGGFSRKVEGGGEIRQCSHVGKVETTDGSAVGGFFVSNDSGSSLMKNCKHVGDVVGAGENGGGIGSYSLSGITFEQVFAGGAVNSNSGVTFEAEFLADPDGTETFTDAYYEESGVGDPNATGLTTDEITGDSAETNLAGFDFSTPIWVTTDSYAVLDVFYTAPPGPTDEFSGTGQLGTVYLLVQYVAPDGSGVGEAKATISDVDQDYTLHQDDIYHDYEPNETRLYIVSEVAGQGSAPSDSLSNNRIDSTLDVSASDANGQFMMSFGNTLEGDHSHDLQTGVIASDTDYPKNCDVLINGNSVGTALGDGSGQFNSVVDIAGQLNEGQVNTIEITSENTGHLQSHIDIDVFRQILGDG